MIKLQLYLFTRQRTSRLLLLIYILWTITSIYEYSIWKNKLYVRNVGFVVVRPQFVWYIRARKKNVDIWVIGQTTWRFVQFVHDPVWFISILYFEITNLFFEYTLQYIYLHKLLHMHFHMTTFLLFHYYDSSRLSQSWY